ncbi:putative choline kinase 2 [Nymphaea thermarum]|nr:putative choline kinase 2 [Nymphaea thermarum]
MSRLVSSNMVANCREAEHSLPKEAQKLLQSLAAGWEDIIDEKELKVVHLKGTMTNEVYQCHWLTKKGASSRKVLVRIYGEGVDVFFDRKDEIRTNWLKVATKICSIEEAAEFELDQIGEEINILEKELSNENHKIGFCHNDLQYGNIMMDEETKVLTIIDYEYATFNPVAYDIANHFCEMFADYHTETPHILDFNKYPGKAALL